MGRPPAGWTRAIRYTPDAVTTSTASPRTATTVPGGPAALAASLGTPSRRRTDPPASGAVTPGHGCRARTRRSRSTAPTALHSTRPSSRRSRGACVARGLVLRRHGDATILEAREHLDQQLGAQGRQPLGERGRRVGRRDRDLARRVHRACVESRVHAHDRHAGARVTGEDRGGHRRGAAPARQHGPMHVDAAVGWSIQQRGRDDLAIGGNNQRLGLEAHDRRNALR